MTWNSFTNRSDLVRKMADVYRARRTSTESPSESLGESVPTDLTPVTDAQKALDDRASFVRRIKAVLAA